MDGQVCENVLLRKDVRKKNLNVSVGMKVQVILYIQYCIIQLHRKTAVNLKLACPVLMVDLPNGCKREKIIQITKNHVNDTYYVMYFTF